MTLKKLEQHFLCSSSGNGICFLTIGSAQKENPMDTFVLSGKEETLILISRTS
jgi:hypothetical protein